MAGFLMKMFREWNQNLGCIKTRKFSLLTDSFIDRISLLDIVMYRPPGVTSKLALDISKFRFGKIRYNTHSSKKAVYIYKYETNQSIYNYEFNMRIEDGTHSKALA